MYIIQTLRRAVQISGNKTATIYAGRQQTWKQFQNRITRLAAALCTLDINKEDRVAILSLNSDRYVEYFYAVAWAGAACNPVNIRLAPAEIAYTLDDSRSRILFIDDAFAAMLPALRPLLHTIEHFIFMGDGPTPEGCLGYENLIQENAPIDDAECGGGDLAGLFYTGGTTGKSKGVMLSHDNLIFNALNVIPVMGYDSDSIYLHAAPMFHLADMASTFAVTMAGACHCVTPRFDVDEVLSSITKHRVTHSLLVPTMVNMLVSSGKLEDVDMSGMKRLLYGASPMPEAVLERAMALLPNTQFTQGYGQTEAAPVISALGPADHIPGGTKLRSAGQAAIGVQVTVRNPDDQEVPCGIVGEICARGENVMLGYWGLEEQTRDTLRNGWLHTGDLGYIDADGYIFIVDRAKDMVISGGENIFSVEVEGAIYSHDSVQECAVIGIPDDKWGEKVHAIVVLKENATATEEDIIEHCKGNIADYKVPRSVSIRTEPLPVSGAGKILKIDLRKPFWEEHSKSVD